jgi:hypothetical protein
MQHITVAESLQQYILTQYSIKHVLLSAGIIYWKQRRPLSSVRIDTFWDTARDLEEGFTWDSLYLHKHKDQKKICNTHSHMWWPQKLWDWAEYNDIVASRMEPSCACSDIYVPYTKQKCSVAIRLVAVTGTAVLCRTQKILKWNHGSEWWVSTEFC